MDPGIIPTFVFPGEIIPGQFGPMRVHFLSLKKCVTFTISRVGIPSVMHTIMLMPADAASKIASAANGGGTKIQETLTFSFDTTSLLVLNTGSPSTF